MGIFSPTAPEVAGRLAVVTGLADDPKSCAGFTTKSLVTCVTSISAGLFVTTGRAGATGRAGVTAVTAGFVGAAGIGGATRTMALVAGTGVGRVAAMRADAGGFVFAESWATTPVTAGRDGTTTSVGFSSASNWRTALSTASAPAGVG